MSHDLSNPGPPGGPDGSAVVEWGHDERKSHRRVSRLLAAVGRDRRLVPLIAGLGLIALLASLVSEWVVITVRDPGPTGDRVVDVPTGVSDAGNLAAAYLLGIVAIVSCAALVLFGSPAIRRNARVTGLALSGMALVMLIAVVASLDEVTPGMYVYYVYGSENQLQIRYGRGLVAAFVAVIALASALYLSGRVVAAAPGPGEAPGPGAADDAATGASEIGWPWRRPRTAVNDGEADGAPIDLTVGPARHAHSAETPSTGSPPQ